VAVVVGVVVAEEVELELPHAEAKATTARSPNTAAEVREVRRVLPGIRSFTPRK
jgi:hypothetical protein